MGFISVVDYTDTDTSQSNFIVKLPRKALPKPVKAKVLDYLNNTGFHSFACFEKPQIDPFNELLMWNTGTTFDDGVYIWEDKLALYVRDHDIALPQEFVDHVLAYYQNGGTVTPEYDWRTERISPLPLYGRAEDIEQVLSIARSAIK